MDDTPPAHPPVRRRSHGVFDRISGVLTRFTGSTGAFALAAGVVVTWGLLGPLFDYSDTWQLVINTGTTIVTFLMVFLIQHTQNKDSLAMQLKLNELIASSAEASNRLVDIEALDDEELRVLHRFYTKLAAMTERAEDLRASHSIDEAEERHAEKLGKPAPPTDDDDV